MRCRPYSGPVALVRLDTGERGERRDHMWRAGPVWVWEENIALYFLFSVLAPELSLSLCWQSSLLAGLARHAGTAGHGQSAVSSAQSDSRE